MWNIRIRRWGAQVVVWVVLAVSVGLVSAMVAIAFATPSSPSIRPVVDFQGDLSRSMPNVIPAPRATPLTTVAGTASSDSGSEQSLAVVVPDPPHLDPILTERMAELVTCGAGAGVLDAELMQLAQTIALRVDPQSPVATHEVSVIASTVLPSAYIAPTTITSVDPEGCTIGDLSWQTTIVPLINHVSHPVTRIGIVVYRYSPYYPPELLLLGQ